MVIAIETENRGGAQVVRFQFFFARACAGPIFTQGGKAPSYSPYGMRNSYERRPNANNDPPRFPRLDCDDESHD